MGTWFRRLFGGAGPPVVPAPETVDGVASQRVVDASTQPTIEAGVAFVKLLLEAEPDRAEPGSFQAALAALDAAADDTRIAARVPRVPAVVPQLLQMLRDPSRAAADIATLIGHDAVLVAAVVRASNSSWYAAGRTVSSLDQAVLIVGQDGLRQLVASVAMKPLINVQSGRVTRTAAPRVWDQSEKAAIACRLLAPALGGNAFEAFLASLLTNMGTVLALRVLDDEPGASAIASAPQACKAFAAASARLAVRVGEHWAFPDTVLETLDSDARSATAALRHAAEHVSRVRILADAARIGDDDVHRLVGERTPLRHAYDVLGA